MAIHKSKRKPSRPPAKTSLSAVSAAEPCQICSGDHKCATGQDGLIVCGRAAGDLPGFVCLGASRGDPQFTLYRPVGDRRPPQLGPGGHAEPGSPAVNWKRRAIGYKKQLTPALRDELAAALGLPAWVPGALAVGWDAKRECWTFPERDASGRFVGIIRRYRDGTKRAMRGGSRGLTHTTGWAEDEGPILLPEGGTDVAALVAMELAAVGRPSCTGGVDLLADRLADVPPGRTIVVLGENDRKPDGTWPGRDGAAQTAERLARRLNRPVLIAFPPAGEKDVRAWFRRQHPDLDDQAGLEALGKALLKALLADAREVILWDPPLSLDDPDLPAFPVDALAAWQRPYVAALAEATQTPPDLAGMLVLAVTSVAVAKKAAVRVRGGYAEPLNTFVAVAQPPASRKTGVFREVVAPVEEFERDRAEEVRPVAAERRAQLEIARKTLEELERRASRAEGAEREQLVEGAKAVAKEVAGMKVPEIPRLVADDVTPEKLASLLAAHGGRIGVLSPEGGVFGVMAGRYSQGKNAANLTVYLKGHAGDTLRVDRQNRQPEFIDRPALSLGLAVQPDVIRGLAQNPGFRGQGLLGRFLFAMPRSRVGHRDVDPPPVPPAVREAYRQGVRALLELPPGTDEAGAPAEHVLTLSPGAYALWLAFSGWLEPQLADFGPLAHVADWAGKLAGAVARVAGLLHAADHAGGPAPWSTPVPESTMGRAIAVGRYLVPHAHAAFAEMGADPAVADARHVLEWVRRRGADGFTRRECFEATKSRFGVVENLQAALDLLERHNYLRERAGAARPGRGRPPSATYDVNPAAFAAGGQAPTAFTPFDPAHPATVPDGPAAAVQTEATGPVDAPAHPDFAISATSPAAGPGGDAGVWPGPEGPPGTAPPQGVSPDDPAAVSAIQAGGAPATATVPGADGPGSTGPHQTPEPDAAEPVALGPATAADAAFEEGTL
jgi:hypothetical protein